MKKKTKKNKSAYFIGIKGVGMTMLAQFFKSQGRQVSGSDINDEFLTDEVLRRYHIPVFSPFAAENIPDNSDIIVHSSAFNSVNNPELKFISEHKKKFLSVPVLSYAQALGLEFNRHRGIAVCGSHGKTTTTAWLGYVLERSGHNPNVLVGSRVPQFKGSGLSGRSPYLIAEVDEYQNKMRFFSPQGVVLNNIDYDHPDYFPTESSYVAVFRKFVKKIPSTGWLVINNDDAKAKKLSRYCLGQVLSYSLDEKSSQADYVAFDLKPLGNHFSFQLYYRGHDQGKFTISLVGRHNVYNALAVIAAARQLGVSWKNIFLHLRGFKGTARRCQILGRYQGATIIDDYAHHPAEIKATLSALRERWPHDRLITVFHPHTFSRTKALFPDFVSSFSQSDELFILDVYSSARESSKTEAKTISRDLAEAITRFNKQAKIKQEVRAVSTIKQVSYILKPRLKNGDRLILMGAGDVFRLAQLLLNK